MSHLLKFDTYQDKYRSKYRIIQPFLMIATGICDIVLLPTKYICKWEGNMLHKMVKSQMKSLMRESDQKASNKKI